MRVFHDLDEVPGDLPPTVVSLGVFDGVHRGHQEVLNENLRTAKRLGALSLALTFDPHPAEVHRPGSGVVMIASLADRLEQLDALGVDVCVVQPYSLDWAAMSCADFVREVLVDTLHAAAVVAGEDVRFGSGNAGDARFLAAEGARLGFSVTIIEDVSGDIEGRRWSSTWIRELLARGDVRGAAVVLGRPHRLRGVVQHGYKRGRELGYPTANLDPDDLGVVPADGVYAGWLVVPEATGAGAGDHERLPAAISIGTNPVFDGVERVVEAHVLGRTDLDLYGQEVVVELVDHLRPMLDLDGVEPLIVQMRADVVDAATVLRVPVPEPLDPAAVTAGRDVPPRT